MDHFDTLETRDSAAREADLFARLPANIALAMTAPGWGKHLAGIDPKSVTGRAALAKLPVLRKSSLPALQKETPPFGGFNVTPPGKAKRLFMSPGPIFEPEGQRGDYNAARALFAAGFREGSVAINCFSLPSHARRLHSRGRCARARMRGHSRRCRQHRGAARCDRAAQAIGLCRDAGLPEDPARCGRESRQGHSSIKRGLVSGAALPPSLRKELGDRGVALKQTYAVAEVGVISYESEALEGMIVNEDMILEIVRPGTGDPVAEGDVGEVVVTSFNPDYPMIRLATGDMSAVHARPSPCGRTNMRIKGWMGRADQTAKVKGMFVRPEQVAELAKRHPELARLRLVVSRENEQDAMTLMAECATPRDGFERGVAETLQSVTKLKGAVKLVAPGSLPNDGKVIADERPVG